MDVGLCHQNTEIMDTEIPPRFSAVAKVLIWSISIYWKHLSQLYEWMDRPLWRLWNCQTLAPQIGFACLSGWRDRRVHRWFCIHVLFSLHCSKLTAKRCKSESEKEASALLLSLIGKHRTVQQKWSTFWAWTEMNMLTLKPTWESKCILRGLKKRHVWVSFYCSWEHQVSRDTESVSYSCLGQRYSLVECQLSS